RFQRQNRSARLNTVATVPNSSEVVFVVRCGHVLSCFCVRCPGCRRSSSLSARRRKRLLSEGDRGESAQRRKNERHAHKPISHFLVLLRMKLLCWWRSRVFQVLVNAFLGDRAAAAVVAQAVTIGSL